MLVHCEAEERRAQGPTLLNPPLALDLLAPQTQVAAVRVAWVRPWCPGRAPPPGSGQNRRPVDRVEGIAEVERNNALVRARRVAREPRADGVRDGLATQL
eukprot:6149678-Pyramimonas_sp.AAC.1